MPYPRDAADSRSHDYVNLKDHPEQLELIPEISDWPELRATLIELNRAGTAFGTIGCEKAICGELPNLGVSGYVQFRLEDIALAKDVRSYVRLMNRLQGRAAIGWPENDAEVEFELQPTVSDDRDEVYWSAAVWLIVRNCNTPETAKERWSSALKFIRTVFLENGAEGLAGS